MCILTGRIERYGGGDVEQSLISPSLKTLLSARVAATIEHSTGTLKKITGTVGISTHQTQKKQPDF